MGYYTDNETGAVLCGFRYYNPGTGQFINRDPIGYDGGANVYALCGNNPINEMDPVGTIAGVDDGVVLAGALLVAVGAIYVIVRDNPYLHFPGGGIEVGPESIRSGPFFRLGPIALPPTPIYHPPVTPTIRPAPVIGL